jgi:PAS domain S-box-containing protein
MTDHELITHPWVSRLKPAVPTFVWLATVCTFLIDLYVPIGFAPWLSYFFLAFMVSRLYPPRTLLLATLLWSVLVLSGAVLLSKGGDPVAGTFNRAVGVGTLWLMAGLFYLEGRSLRARFEDESRIHAIVQGALDAVVTMDRSGVVVEWNPQAEATFGFTRAEAVGVTLAELIIPPQYRAAHAAGMQRFLKTGKEVILKRRIEITALRKDGREFPVELTVIPLQVGREVMFSSFIRDITELRQAEEDQKEYRKLDALGAAVGQSLTTNRSLNEKLGDCAQALVDQLNAAFARIWTLNEKEQMLELQASAGMYTHRDGAHSRIPMGRDKIGVIAQERKPHVTNEVVGDARVSDQEWAKREGMVAFAGYPLTVDDQLVGVMAVFARHPLTPFALSAMASMADLVAMGIHHHRAGEEVQRQESRLRAIVDYAVDGIMTLDEAGLIESFNPAAERMFGYPASAVVGCNVRMLLSGSGVHLTEDGQIGRPAVMETVWMVTGQRADGTTFPMECSVSEVDLGTRRMYMGVVRDVTMRNAYEDALIKARLAAEEASQAKSDFLANMSHEMRTPLNAVIGLTDFLLRTPLSPDQANLLKRCEKAGTGLLRMIEDLLQAAKLDSRTLELVSEPFVLRELVTDTVELLNAKAQAKGLSLSVRIDPGLPALVLGDALRLQQVLLNLIGNAVKFTAEGGVEVRVKPLPGEADAGAVQFEVADTGIGIPPDQYDKIFERFSQVDSRGSRAFGGAGLGLSICQQLIGLMGGRIVVESKPGCGSTFTVTARFEVVPAEMEELLESCRVASSAEDTTTGALVQVERGLKILLAEDCVESQELMALYVRGTSHTMDCAESGGGVVERYKAGGYDLIFMDLQMPGMDGYAATRAIRAWEEAQDLPRVPIIALTANAEGEVQRKSVLAGCTGFVTKPVKEATVLGVIRRFMAAPAEGGRGDNQPVSQGEKCEQNLQALRPKFVRNRREDVTILQSAILARNIDLIRTIGHRIKGLAGSYGLEAIGLIGSAIEQSALDHDFERVTVEVQRLVEALREAEGTRPGDRDHTAHSQ